jgi:ribonuclease VapC
MIIDTSAVVAIVRLEPDGHVYEELIATAVAPRMSAATFVEFAIVIDRLMDPRASGALDAVISTMAITVEPLTERQARLARDAYQRFGKGSGHPARLNMGDCFSYALAKDLGEPLLFKGDDFRLTDIEIVTTPIRHRRLSEVVASYGERRA